MSRHTKKKINLAVVDDQQLFRRGIISLLKEFNDFNIMLEAPDGKVFLEEIRKKQPDVVLLDIEMPVLDGVKTTEQVRMLYPDVKIIILTLHDEESFIVHLIEKGAHGFLLKNNEIETVVEAIHSVVETGYYFSDRVSRAMVKGLMHSKMIVPSFNTVNLTEREIEIIRLICKEYTNKEMSEELCLSIRTIDGHRKRIIEKIGARNTAGVVMYAMKNNLVL